MSDFYNRQGEPITIDVWITHYEDRAYQILVQEYLANGMRVSTVWLGLDHNFGGGPPLIFETMVFHASGRDMATFRYSTEQEAFAGHVAAVAAAESVPPVT